MNCLLGAIVESHWVTGIIVFFQEEDNYNDWESQQQEEAIQVWW
jgi:hypothetical protein